MTEPGGGGLPSADGPLDDVDIAILDGVRAAYQQVDPMPVDLPDRIRFALSLRRLGAEIARLTEDEGRPALLARGAEQSQTMTFDSDSLTIMIRVEPDRNDTVRVDGWLAPPATRTIELKSAGGSLLAVSDEQGRFAFSSVPRGVTQLVVRPAGGEAPDAGPSVLTPAVVL
jgi:hypothetical protein